MERSLVRFKEIVAGGWGQPYRFERVQIPSDEVVEADPDNYSKLEEGLAAMKAELEKFKD